MQLADLIAQRVRSALGGAIQDEKDDLTDIAKAGGDAAAGGLLGDVGRITDVFANLTGIITDIPVIGGIFKDVLGVVPSPLKAIDDAGGKFGRGMGLGYFAGYFLWELCQPVLLPVIHGSNAFFHNEIIQPNDAMTAAAKGILTKDQGQSIAQGNGLDHVQSSILFDLATTFPALSEVLELLRRDIIKGDEAHAILARNGIAGQHIDHLLDLSRVRLSPADWALAELRGVVQHADGVAGAAAQGVSEADYDILIENTGEPPGLMQLLEAYRRGFIKEPDLNRGIKQSRVRDEWIPVVKDLRYSPMSIADSVRAVVENYMPQADGEKIADENGLTPGHYDYLVKSWGRPLSRTEMASLVHRGLAKPEQFDQAMRESDLKDKYIQQAYDVSTRLMPERMIVQAIQHGVLPAAEGALKFLQLGYSQEDATILMKLGLSQATASHKELTRAEIVQLYEGGILKRADAEAYLKTLKYDASDIALMLNLADAKTHAATLKQEQTVIKDSLLAGRIDKLTAQQQLIAAGVDQLHADSLVEQWLKLHGKATRSLTQAQIVKAAEYQVMDIPTALNELVGLGMSRADATVLLQTAGLKVG